MGVGRFKKVKRSTFGVTNAFGGRQFHLAQPLKKLEFWALFWGDRHKNLTLLVPGPLPRPILSERQQDRDGGRRNVQSLLLYNLGYPCAPVGASMQGHLSWGEGRFLASLAQTPNQESAWRLPLVVRWRHCTVRAWPGKGATWWRASSCTFLCCLQYVNLIGIGNEQE